MKCIIYYLFLLYCCIWSVSFGNILWAFDICICEVYCCVLLGTISMRDKGSRTDRQRDWIEMHLQKRSQWILWGVLELGWSIRAVLNWGRELSFVLPHLIVTRHLLPLGRSVASSEAAPFSQAVPREGLSCELLAFVQLTNAVPSLWGIHFRIPRGCLKRQLVLNHIYTLVFPIHTYLW